MDNVRAIGDHQGLLHVVIGDQNPDVPLFELSDNALDIPDGNRVDAGERLIQHEKVRSGHQRAGNLHPSPFATLKRKSLTAAHMIKTQVLNTGFQPFLLVFLRKAEFFKDHH